MRVLVFGQTGQVARAVVRQADAMGISLVTLGRAEADLANPAACAAVLSDHILKADVVINAAAYTAVDKAEAEPDVAFAVNALAPAAMAQVAATAGKPFLHISTDYVFDGSGEYPWQVDAQTGPLGVYGASKLAGEQGVRAAAGVHVILRTSWVFSADGSNFVKTMLRLGATRDQLTVVADQIGGPTPAAAIADALLRMARDLHQGRGQTGTYHFAGTPDVSWADFAREVFAQSGMAVEVAGIATTDYPTPARRPANSRLDCTTLAEVFGIDRPDWRQGLATVLANLRT